MTVDNQTKGGNEILSGIKSNKNTSRNRYGSKQMEEKSKSLVNLPQINAHKINATEKTGTRDSKKQ